MAKSQGRWPANIIHDGSDEVLKLFPETGVSARPNSMNKEYSPDNIVYGDYNYTIHNVAHHDFGSAGRYFVVCDYTEEDDWQGE